jgi:hypothetical protein
LRPECHAQIVVRISIQEKDIVAGLNPNSDPMREQIEARGRINRKSSRTARQANGIGEPGGRVLVAYAETIEAYFSGHEYLKRPGAGVEIWSKEGVQSAEFRGDQRSRYAIAEGAGVVLAEIVSHFCFDRGMRSYAHPDPTAQTDEILW